MCMWPLSFPIRFTSSVWVYPHVYGATIQPILLCNRLLGLSPCVWGHLYLSPLMLFHIGSIPMCMGPPCSACCTASSRRVYPHVYGATFLFQYNDQIGRAHV